MLRLLVTLVIAIGLAGPAVVLPEPPVAAAATEPSCTGWHSVLDPPETVRVGRRDGTVDVVNFRTYVYRVMVKEWGGIKYAASLETAAVAVKQYAWYYALAGNWRRSYVTDSGQCFDVKDGTADQLYRDDVIITERVRQAVDNSWGLTVRKNNKFFLTGYRSGNTYECGVDANGWKLYSKSVAACGRDGLTREQIQLIYYAPDVTFHWSPAVETGVAAAVDTAISAPRLEVLTNVAFGGANTRVSWDAGNQRPAGTYFQFQRVISGAWSDVTLTDATQTSVVVQLKTGTRQGFRVRLRDQAGNYGMWHSTGTFMPRLVQDSNDTGVLEWSPEWAVLRSRSALGNTVRRTEQPGSSVSYTFTGKGVALIGTRGPDFGRANIYIDGVLQKQINLRARKERWRHIVYAQHWNKSATRTITVEVVAGPAGSKFHFDAAVRLP